MHVIKPLDFIHSVWDLKSLPVSPLQCSPCHELFLVVFLRHRLLAKRERPFNGQHSAFSLSLCGSLPFEGPWLRGGGGLKPTARTLACQKLLESIRAFFYLSFSLSVSISLSPAISLPRGHDPFWHQPAPYRPSLHLSMFTKFSVGAVWKTDARTYQI